MMWLHRVELEVPIDSSATEKSKQIERKKNQRFP